jgi:hypothetical protein
MKKLLSFLLLFCFLTGSAQNPPFTDIGFENLALGPNTSTAWISMSGNSVISILCPPQFNQATYVPNNLTSSVVTVPLIDPSCFNVGPSPFVGTRVMSLNKAPVGSRTKMSQNFFVNNTNFIYRYAYVGVLDASHPLCDAGSLIFNFYDCNNVLIGALSKTIVASYNNASNIDAPFWNIGAPFVAGGPISNGLAYTPAWVMHSANLIPYIGSCVTVEVIVSGCTCAGWPGYCYYDSESSDRPLQMPNNTLYGGGNYTVCANSTTLTGIPGAGSFLWQGPANSGVSGSTSPSVATSVAGNYSLTVTSGTTTILQTFNLTFVGAPTLSLSASSPSICPGGTVNIQASGNALASLSWDGAPTTTVLSLVASPTTGTLYSAISTNSFGCNAYSTIFVSVYPSPQLVQITATSTNVCQGVPVNLTAAGNANVSYTWSTGSNAAVISQTLSSATVFSVSATNTLGCVSSDTITINTYPYIPVQVTASSPSACAGQTIGLAMPSPGVASYTWNNGQMNQPISITLNNSGTYMVMTTDMNGCPNSASVALSAIPLPVVQISPSTSLVCAGQGVTLTASSGQVVSCLWSNGYSTSVISEVPSATTLYTVSVVSVAGCWGGASLTVVVSFPPQVQITVPTAGICSGESAILTTNGSGSNTYAWSTGGTGPSITITPSTTAIYSVTATNADGCSSTSMQLLEVHLCTGFAQAAQDLRSRLEVFPNPTNGMFTIKSSGETRGLILNALGQVVREFSLEAANNFSQSCSGFAAGVYIVKTPAACTKVIVE